MSLEKQQRIGLIHFSKAIAYFEYKQATEARRSSAGTYISNELHDLLTRKKRLTFLEHLECKIYTQREL